MNQSAFTFPDRVRYYLVHLESGNREYISEPRGWYDDEKSMSRDKTYFGITRKTSDSLQFLASKVLVKGEFILGGYEFITNIKENIGVDETIVVVREERNNQTDVYEEDCRSELDLFTYVSESNDSGETYCSLKSSDAGLDATLKARKSEAMEITRRFALDDSDEENELPEIETELVELRGRRIDLPSGLILKESLVVSQASASRSPQMDLEYTSTESVKAVTKEDLSTVESSNLFFTNFTGESIDTIKNTYSTKITNTGSVSCLVTISSREYKYTGGVWNPFASVRDLQSRTLSVGEVWEYMGSWTETFTPTNNGLLFYIRNRTFSTGSEATLSECSLYVNETSDQVPTTTKAYRYKVAFDRYLELMTGRSGLFRSDFFDTIGRNFLLTDGELVRNVPVTSENSNARTHQLETSFKDCFDAIDAGWSLGLGIERDGLREYLRIEQKEYFFQPYVVVELGELRNAKESTASEFIYSGINIGYDGEAKIEGIQGLDKTSGKVNRITKITGQEKSYNKISKHQTDDYLRELQRRKQFSTSPTEDVKYDEVKMILDCQNAVSDISLKILDNDLHQKGVILNVPTISSNKLFFQFSTTPTANAITIGADEEETMQNAFIYLTEVDFYKDYFDYTLLGNTITGVCKLEWRWVELVAENLGGSVSYVIGNYGVDSSDRTYRQRTSEDDFDSVPTGVYDAEGLTNGRWTPLAMMLRHGSWVRAGLNNYKDSNLSFGSSNSNTQLTGTLRNDNNYPYLKGINYSESSNIGVNDLEGNFFDPKWIEGNHVVTQEIMRKLEGYSEINGKKFKTFYGLFSFVVNGETRTGFVFDVKPNGDGSWKFLSFRKR